MSKSWIGPGNHDKAWNDPPQFAFNASHAGQSTSNRLRMMKKRIPVPINSSSNPAQNLCEQSLSRDKSCTSKPPLLQPPKDETAKCKEKEASNEESDGSGSEEMLNHTLESLMEVCNNVDETNMKNSSKEDILKRLSCLEEMWIQNKLPLEVQRQMKALADALKEGDFSLAWSLHLSLMVDYTTDCSAWMFAVKTLITEAQKDETTGSSETKPKTSTSTSQNNSLANFLNPNSD